MEDDRERRGDDRLRPQVDSRLQDQGGKSAALGFVGTNVQGSQNDSPFEISSDCVVIGG